MVNILLLLIILQESILQHIQFLAMQSLADFLRKQKEVSIQSVKKKEETQLGS